VVINIHHFDEFIIRRHSLQECSTIFDRLWTQIASYFKDYSGKLIFEGYNEYLGGNVFNASGQLTALSRSQAYQMVNTLNQTFVTAVRNTGGNNALRPLIVSGYWTNIDLTTSPEFVMPTDTAPNSLMVSVHYVDNNMYWSNKIGGQTWQSYIKNQCEELKRAFTDKGIPVFIGETTSYYPSDKFDSSPQYKTSAECLNTVLSTLLGYGFVPVLWDTNSYFYNRTTYKINDDASAEVIKKLAK
jgi:endoglucanase